MPVLARTEAEVARCLAPAWVRRDLGPLEAR